MLKGLVSILLLSSGIAQAQVRQDPAMRLQVLERRVQQLQALTANLDSRLRNVEYSQAPYPPPNDHYQPSVTQSAILVDTGYSKTFFGSGITKLEAEAIARQECGKVVNAAYCNGAVRFGQADPRARGAYCVVIDSGYQKTFSGRGADMIEAEAKAKQACQASVNASYCGNVTARCEVAP